MIRQPVGPTATRRKRKRAKLTAAERANKDLVRERDRHCRFPRCGCINAGHGLKGIPTVSHDQHKGMGGDPTGDRSQPELMIVLCKWRHQDAPVSRHAMTLRTRYLTPEKNNGPLAFEVDLHAVYPGLYERSGVWFEVAREYWLGGVFAPPFTLEPLTDEQARILDDLAEMDR